MDALISKITTHILNPIVGLMVAIAVLYFVWGVVDFIAGAANQEKREVGKQHIIYGIIGLFIMISFYGLMNVICNTFGLPCTS